MATRAIDRLPLKGIPADPRQERAFPRAYMASGTVVRQDRFTYPPGWWYEDEVPQRVKDACCEQALFLLSISDYDLERQHSQLFGITSESIGAAREFVDSGRIRQNTLRPPLSPVARELLLPFLVGRVIIR